MFGEREREQPRRSARCEMRGVRSDSGCGVAKHGADGPARRSSSVSRAWWTGPPPIRSPQTATGHDRMTRPSRRSSSRGAACGSGSGPGATRAAVQGTGRLNRPARLQGWLKGGLDIPATYAQCRSLQREHPLRTLTRCGSRAGRERNAVFAHIARSFLKRRCPWFISPSNKALATVPFPSGMVGRFLKPQFRAQHERPGFPTARPCRTTSGPRDC